MLHKLSLKKDKLSRLPYQSSCVAQYGTGWPSAVPEMRAKADSPAGGVPKAWQPRLKIFEENLRPGFATHTEREPRRWRPFILKYVLMCLKLATYGARGIIVAHLPSPRFFFKKSRTGLPNPSGRPYRTRVILSTPIIRKSGSLSKNSVSRQRQRTAPFDANFDAGSTYPPHLHTGIKRIHSVVRH